MTLDLQFKINNNELLIKYLKENSYMYKYLNRSDIYFNDFINYMKEDYKLRTSDKVNNFINKLDMLSSFIEVLK